jgi:NAD(P)-dependent dehydrogenase (short-subunit alcohol dehydrogenase family)
MSFSSISVENLFAVHDKVCVITGGNRGIGAMIASGFVKNGATVYIVARDKETGEKTADELNKLGPGKCVSLTADLSTETECIRVSETVKTLSPGGIDVLINK